MNTTLCYIQRANKYLLLFRNKKKHDVNQGKYVGVGGKFLPGETPDECLLREVREETGFRLTEFQLRGLVRFESDTWENEDMYLYTATAFTWADGTPAEGFPVPECAEGTFQWVDIAQVENLPAWEGDRHFLRALAAGRTDIRMTLTYVGDTLVRAEGV
ncbi:MAG: 8-oxo-dGTP diphosphatase [Coriobacteriia bacterium]|nr:8-oxo-dGTP diphosphatase [Coriobacteriia bacterium]